MTNRVPQTNVTLSCFWHLLFFCILSAMADDADLLISFKSSLPNPNLLSNWNHKHGVCEFQGIACKKGQVCSVMIRELPLAVDFSLVSTHILSLRNLEVLTLHSTNLTGFILAHPLKCANRLTELDLSSNNLQGSVSDVASFVAACPSLQSLNFSGNYIGEPNNCSSPVPLPHLKMLDLSDNNVGCTMPQFTNCTSLQYLDLSSNVLYGTITAGTFSSCLNLTYLNLSSNHFTGKAPPDIEACAKLETISLFNNNFSGQFPIKSLVGMPRLHHLELAFNNFNDSLPKSISKLTKLELLDLSANRFSGLIPQSLCKDNVSRLKVLDLQDNYFTGSIPDSLSNCTNLVSLDLSMNLLSGPIPSSLGSLLKLHDLVMWQNNLNGEIPAELSSLKLLTNLHLDYNNLTGIIPDSLMNCTSINWISLASNMLTGSIPSWIGNLEQLVILILGNNSFTGSIPPQLGDCKSLLYLDLSSNQLNGSIPSSLAKQSGKITKTLQERDRKFFDKRIMENSRCHHMNIFLEFDGIRYNDLMRMPTTRYCSSLQGYQAMIGQLGSFLKYYKSMAFLDLSYNQLGGHIPTELSTMLSLMVLHLEYNLLIGQLPPELGRMKGLFKLDLSHNMLEGSIPSSYSTLSLSELDLSNNRLSGPIPEQGSLVTFSESTFANNSGLCGLPLPPCNNKSTLKADESLQSSATTNYQNSLSWWITLGLLFSAFFVIGFVIGFLNKLTYILDVIICPMQIKT